MPRLSAQSSDDRRPNVLFLAVDDMRDWVNCLHGYSGTVHTPNIDALAARGVLFSNAHCASPKCAPSRAAIMTGRMPSTTGLYDNGHWWYPNLPDVVTLPVHFRNHGYRVVGAGKIFHHTAGNHPPNQWDDYLPLRFRDDPWFRHSKLNYPWSESSANPEGFPFAGFPGLSYENDWGSPPIPEQDYDDALTAEYAVRFLNSAAAKKPFFLACGLFRPHLPWYVHQRFFDPYPLDTIKLPPVLPNDLADVPPVGKALAQARLKDLSVIRTAGKWREGVRAYLASITYADHLLGRVLNALNESGQAERTIIVLWSDHGWHLGEKDHWHKSTLWEAATRVPLIVSAPGMATGECTRPVSLIHLYPTLIDLCDLAGVDALDGQSLMPLLKDPRAEWQTPVVVEFRRGNAAVRSERYRLIRYADGGEEVYDHAKDPYEWRNRAGDPQYQGIRDELAQALPDEWAPDAPTKKAFTFDPETFSWTEKGSGRRVVGKR